MVKAKKKATLYIEATEQLKERLQAVAEANQRSLNGEAVYALERYVKAEEARLKAEQESEQ